MVTKQTEPDLGSKNGRRLLVMNTDTVRRFLGLAAVGAVVLLAGCQHGNSASSEPGSQPPASGTLASGSFTADLGSWGQVFDIEAAGTGDDVSGSLEVSIGDEGFSVDLRCARTRDDGLLVIGGAVTESTSEISSEAQHAAILLAPGTPARTALYLDVIPGDDPPSPADSCPSYLDSMFSDTDFLELTGDDLRPIEGDLELGS
jgi:hypothetical protein